MGRRWSLALAGALTLSLAFGGTASAGDRLSATLAGAKISLGQAGKLSCHDLDFPVLRCFATATDMEQDALGRRQTAQTTAGTFAILDVGYVIVYEHATYGGAALLLSADQAWLSSIGWNDRISSFKSFGATGSFRENSPTGGFIYSFNATALVSYVGSAYNDKFSALYIN